MSWTWAVRVLGWVEDVVRAVPRRALVAVRVVRALVRAVRVPAVVAGLRFGVVRLAVVAGL
ncbi:MAG TPA: hypothetical protein VMF57_00795 [Solirubrobacteraceae bacterium]|nr:hypothetical protein [Solirubrobacteraceae bacterium]